jgi:hypothetical protein
MIAQKMNVGNPFVRRDGKMIYPVNGYLLTTEQILELDSKDELTSWGVRELSDRLAIGVLKPVCPIHRIEMLETAEADVPGVLFYYCPPPTSCSARYSNETGHIATSDLPSGRNRL